MGNLSHFDFSALFQHWCQPESWLWGTNKAEWGLVDQCCFQKYFLLWPRLANFHCESWIGLHVSVLSWIFIKNNLSSFLYNVIYRITEYIWKYIDFDSSIFSKDRIRMKGNTSVVKRERRINPSLPAHDRACSQHSPVVVTMSRSLSMQRLPPYLCKENRIRV